jgi:cytochrome b561
MSNSINFNKLIRSISSLLLLLCFVFMLLSVVFPDLEIGEFEMEESHEVFGWIFFALMLIHIVLYWKSMKNMFNLKSYFRKR